MYVRCLPVDAIRNIGTSNDKTETFREKQILSAIKELGRRSVNVYYHTILHRTDAVYEAILTET